MNIINYLRQSKKNTEAKKTTFISFRSKVSNIIVDNLVKNCLARRFVPPFAFFTMKLANDVFAKRKFFLKSEEVIPIEVPKYYEFTVKKIYEIFKSDERVMSFLPDIADANKPACRKYVMDVVSSLRPEFMK
jgi:hypothetical protein